MEFINHLNLLLNISILNLKTTYIEWFGTTINKISFMRVKCKVFLLDKYKYKFFYKYSLNSKIFYSLDWIVYSLATNFFYEKK
jgi:hypothetical protein